MTERRINGLVPWPPDRVTEDPTPQADVDRLMVFVPAIMSVGVIFSIVTLMRDLFHWTGGRARDRRAEIAAGSVVGSILGETEPNPDDIGILTRPTYLITAILLVGGAAYVAIGSAANFMRDQGYVRDIGWLLAVSLGLSLVLGFLGGVSLAVFRSWPNPPPWTYGSLRRAPLSTTPGRADLGPSWTLTSLTIGAALVTALLTLIVGSGRSIALRIDRPISDWLVEAAWLDRLSFLDPFGATPISVGLVLLIGLSAFRCRVMALAYPLAFLVSWIGAGVVREIIDRPRPIRFGDIESFPSGHMIQAVFIAGLVPLALEVLLSDRRAAIVSRAVLVVAVVASGLHRIHAQFHWPLDALAGVTFGLTVVLTTHWVIEHREWHRGCSSCPWSPNPGDTPWSRGVFTIGATPARWLGLVGAVGAVVAALVLFVATAYVGLPTDPEGFGFGSTISGPLQLGLAAVMAAAGLIALRWKAVAAFLMAFAATGLGLFASVEYRPLFTVLLFGLLFLPAVFTWLAWQPNETVGRIATLAAVTVTLLTTTAMGSNEIYKHYFGPTHPESDAEGLESAEADWLWLGDVDAYTATVVAGGLDAGEAVEIRVWPTDGAARNAALQLVEHAVADEHGVARFNLTRLEPTTSYRYAVGEQGETDDGGPGDAGFSTFDDGPQSLTVVLGSCARVGSNGAVFDAMVAEDPDLYIALGDLHYANLESTDPGRHIAEYGRSLSQPGQAALFSSVPTAYVWDDHDYGPNNSDASSSSRSAVSMAYRRAVPHAGVDPDIESSIAQAFSIGRVRFVLSDNRSHRTPTSMLGHEQQRWLIEEITAASKSHGLVVWVNPTPWIGTADPNADDWSAYPADRVAIADAIAAADVRNLIMVSGDAHMLAIDDGTNSGYASDGSPGFPVLHAAALDRPGSIKGGPYSHGAFPGSGQYGLLEVEDDGGSTIGVRLSGRTWTEDELVELELAIEVGPSVD
ncbi:MAG: alkaline phosphatase D family protein [Acidimicrobiales bacterium]